MVLVARHGHDRCAIPVWKGSLWPHKRHDFDSLSPEAPRSRCARRTTRKSRHSPTWRHGWCRAFRSRNRTSRILQFRSQQYPDLRVQGQTARRLAFFFLNDRGHDALILGLSSDVTPGFRIASPASEQVVRDLRLGDRGAGRGMAGLGNVSAHLRQPRLLRRRSLSLNRQRRRPRSDDRDRLRTDPELLSTISGAISAPGIVNRSHALDQAAARSLAFARYSDRSKPPQRDLDPASRAIRTI